MLADSLYELYAIQRKMDIAQYAERLNFQITSELSEIQKEEERVYGTEQIVRNMSKTT